MQRNGRSFVWLLSWRSRCSVLEKAFSQNWHCRLSIFFLALSGVSWVPEEVEWRPLLCSAGDDMAPVPNKTAPELGELNEGRDSRRREQIRCEAWFMF
jgi:hypothetical protein